MRHRNRLATIPVFVVAFCLGLPVTAAGQDRAPTFGLEVELGPIWQSKNDVQIPNTDLGTRFSLVDLAGQGPWFSGRVYFTWNINQRHAVRALIAPLSYTETGTFDSPQRFAGESYDADTPTEATYQFNSWRLTYRYRLVDNPKWQVFLGGTAKIRDAKIELRQGDKSSKDDDLGFVPLLHVAAQYRFSPRWTALADLDALAGGPGRAIDLALKVGYDVNDSWTVTAGYRTVEGGADTDDVYNFAWFHSAVLSGVFRF